MKNKLVFTIYTVLTLLAIIRAVTPAEASYISNGAGGGSSLPSQSGNTGKFLQTDGSAADCCLSWATSPAPGMTAGDLASLPSAAATGSGGTYITTDSNRLYVSDGAAYTVFGPVFRFVPPVNADYSWVNQGSATLDTNGGSLLLTATASGSNDAKLRVKTLPAAPYTITMYAVIVLNGLNYSFAGMVVRDSGTGKFIAHGILNDTVRSYVYVGKYNNPTSFSATYTQAPIGTPGGGFWLRITDDATNRIYYWSPDGFNWVEITRTLNTDFITPDEAGYFADSNTSNQTVRIALQSWEEN